MATRLSVGRAAHRPLLKGTALAGLAGRPASQPVLWLAALLVAFTLLAVWLLSGVPVGDIAKYVAFEALYVLLPGCLLCVLLSPVSWELGSAPGGWLRILAIGWPLGYALEIGAFALTAALHIRGVFALLPLLAALVLVPCIVNRRRRARPTAVRGDGVLHRDPASLRGQGAASLLAAGAIALALVLLAFRYYAIYPLPEHARSVFYFLDNIDYVAFSAEALHHWPITEPFLAGHPFRYYTGLFMHTAAIKQVMGVSLAMTIFRLLPATLILVAALQFWCLGGLLGRSRWAGPLTVALLIVIENMKLFPTHTKVFGVALFSEFVWSPSYGFGVIFFLGLLILMRTRLLGMGTAGVQGESDQAPEPSAAGPRTQPSSSDSMQSGVVGSLAALAILVLGGSAMKAPAVATFVGGLGLFWLWRLATKRRVDRLLSLCLALSLACFGAMYLLMLSGAGSPAASLTEFAPLNFLKYTVFASTLVSHPGLAPLLGVAVVICTWKLLPVLGTVWPLKRRGWTPYVSLALATFTVGFVVSALMGSPADNEIYFVWYGYIAVIPIAATTLIYLWRERRPMLKTSSRRVRVAVYGVLLVAALGCAQSIALAVPQTWRTILDKQRVPLDSKSHPGMTAALYRGLVWVRDHTNSCDLLAANTHYFTAPGASPKPDAGYFYYSAFTERRVLLESWVLTYRGARGEQPYPALYALNSAATLRGSPAAVREIARKGVSYILIDKSHEGSVREPPSVSRLVFSNSALDVYRVTTPVGPRDC
ncbi:MAG: hypothetical protein ACHQE6_06085 [Solirubrobacterales bacterium]